MIRNELLLNVITDAISVHIEECCMDAFQRGVERGRYEERFDQRKAREEADAKDKLEVAG